MKNIIAQGNKGKTNQPNFSCAATISVKFNDPDKTTTGKIKIPKETS
jgi:hypothetical protein